MGCKIINRRRLVLSLGIILIVSFIVIIIILMKRDGKSADTFTKAENSKKIYLSVADDGNVSYEENELFKKYTFKCTNIIEDIISNEDNNVLSINFAEDEKFLLNSLYFDETNSEDIYISKEEKQIKIKIDYNGQNKIFTDYFDNSNLIVLVSKVENPFTYKVFVDPGHGGVDKGVNIDDVYEKDITLKIAKLMVGELTYNGCEVKLSRNDDKLNSLVDISEMGNNMNADVLISIHINSFPQSQYGGIGCYYTDNGYFTEDRIKLAKAVQKNAIKDDGWTDRGIFKEKLKVLSYSKIPSTLIECGFLTNPEDRERLSNDEVLIRLSKNISNGILEYLYNR